MKVEEPEDPLHFIQQGGAVRNQVSPRANTKEKNTDILKNLNKGMANDFNNKNNNVIENITGLKAS